MGVSGKNEELPQGSSNSGILMCPERSLHKQGGEGSKPVACITLNYPWVGGVSMANMRIYPSCDFIEWIWYLDWWAKRFKVILFGSLC